MDFFQSLKYVKIHAKLTVEEWRKSNTEAGKEEGSSPPQDYREGNIRGSGWRKKERPE